MRPLATLLTYLAALGVTAVAMFFAVLFLAGPHGGLLPSSLHGVALTLAWIVVLVLPALAARWTWRRVKPA